MSTVSSATLFDELNRLYELFQAPAIYTDWRERQEVLNGIKKVQGELRTRHGWRSKKKTVR